MQLRKFVRQNRAQLEETLAARMNYVHKEASCDCTLSGTNHVHKKKTKFTIAELEDLVINYPDLYLWWQGSR